MKKINFGIIIPIFNVSKYLRTCLESVINQSYPHLQIVCVDDGSQDDSFEIAYEYFLKDRRLFIIQTPNHGLSHARNVGIDFLLTTRFQSLLSGEGGGEIKCYFHDLPLPVEYIHFLDSDDYFHLDCIQECAKLFNQFGHLDVIWHNYWVFDEELQSTHTSRHLPFKEGVGPTFSSIDMLRYMRTKHLNFAWHGALRTDLLNDIRFIEGIEYEDVAFAFMLFSKVSWVGIIEKPLLCYRIREGSITNPKAHATYPPYMKDLEGYFDDFIKAKFYYFFYSDCINILHSHAYIADSKSSPQLIEGLKQLLEWRVLQFLSINIYQIKKSNDPRKCIELFGEIQAKGYKVLTPKYLLYRILKILGLYDILYACRAKIKNIFLINTKR